MKLMTVMAENFRAFDHVEFSFANQTVIRGRNGAGKSSIAEAVVWCLYGTNIYGKTKADPTLIGDPNRDMSVVTVWENLAGQAVTVQRIKPAKGTGSVLVNGSRVSPGQIEGLFFPSVNEFLSVFIPGFFSSLEPKDAKAILTRYSEVRPEDVLKKLGPEARERLEHVQFGMGYDSVEVYRKKVAAELKDMEAEKLRLEGEIRSFEDALAAGRPETPVPTATPENVAEAERLRALVEDAERQVRNRDRDLSEWQRELREKRATFRTVRDTLLVVQDVCPTCGQAMSADVRNAVDHKAHAHNDPIQSQLDQLERQGTDLVAKIEKLKATPIPTQEDISSWRAFVAQVDQATQVDRDAKSRYDVQLQAYERAKKVLSERKQESVRQTQLVFELEQRLTAVKLFRHEYVRSQQAKLDTLLDKVKLSLSKIDEDGEIKDAFAIRWNGKPYQTLSMSERVRCDLEIGRAIVALRDNAEPMPVFVDDAEGVEDLFDEPFNGQVIGAYRFTSQLMVQSRDDVAMDLAAEVQELQALIGGHRPMKRGA